VELAVLVDRAGRRLPVAANYIGLTLAVADTEKVVVHLEADKPAQDSVVVTPTAAIRKLAS
jgi:pyrimidine operon attenuation protein/uracil phosphoribosyltransferase